MRPKIAMSNVEMGCGGYQALFVAVTVTLLIKNNL